MTQPRTQLGPALRLESEMAAALGLKREDVEDRFPLRVAGAGLSRAIASGPDQETDHLALVLLCWPLIARLMAQVRPPKPKAFDAEQPVD